MVIAGMTRTGKRWHYEHSKACALCHTIKDVAEFYAMPSKGGRLHSYCKTCNRNFRKQWDAARQLDDGRGAYQRALLDLRQGKTVRITLLTLPDRRKLVTKLLATGRPPKVVARLLRCDINTVYAYVRAERKIRDGAGARLSYA